MQDVYILLSLLTVPDMTTLVTLEAHFPGGNDSVSLVPVRNWKIKIQNKIKDNLDQNNCHLAVLFIVFLNSRHDEKAAGKVSSTTMI